jgi:predicted methyltransferase
VDRFPNADVAISALAEERDNVTRLVSEVPTILDGYDSELDGVFMMLIYHDQAWAQEGFEAPTREDRLAMNRSIYNALRPGGVFLVVDHRSEDGTGDSVIGDYHRIEESFVREEIEAAGFELAAESDLLSNPDDSRTISVFDPSIRGNTDRFVLLYRKPL